MSSFLDNYPSIPPPPGIKPNFVDPPSQGPTVVAVAAVFTTLATVMTCVRFYVRISLTKSIGWDDYTCGLAVTMTWLQTALLIQATHIGFGRHMWDIPASVLLQSSNVSWISSNSAAYSVAIALIKISILLLYYRIFGINKTFRQIIIGSIVIVAMVYTAYAAMSVVTIVQCVSLTAVASSPLCLQTYPITLSQSIVNVVTDLWILILPFKSILALKLNKSQRIGLVAVFSTGTITCALSLARAIYLGLTLSITDVFWTAALSTNITLVELNVAIMMACAPVLPRFCTTIRQYSSTLYRTLIHRTSTTSSSSSNYKNASLYEDLHGSRAEIYAPPSTQIGVKEQSFNLCGVRGKAYDESRGILRSSESA